MIKNRKKIMKIISLAMCTSILTSVNVFAKDNGSSINTVVTGTQTKANAKSDSFEFDKATGTITKYKGSEANVIIPNEINGIKVTSIGERAFGSNLSLTSVEIPEGVTTLAQYAFGGCKNLSKIVVPNTVTDLGVHTFNLGVSNGYSGDAKFYIKSDKIRKELINVGTKQSQIILENDNNITDKEGFEIDKKTGMLTGYVGTSTDVNIPSEIAGVKITSIGDQAFEFGHNSGKITSIEIPDGVTSIGDKAFMGCFELKKIKIPNTVTHIGEMAFWNCDKLVDTTIPDSVTSIASNAFNSVNYSKDSTVNVESDRVKQLLINSGKNKSKIILKSQSSSEVKKNDGNIVEKDGFIFDKYQQKILGYKGSDTNVVIPKKIAGREVREIGDEAFLNRNDITSVEMPDGLRIIGKRAFCGCINLKNVSLPNMIDRIYDEAFYKCINITSMKINVAVYIGKDALKGFGGTLYIEYESQRQVLINASANESQIVLIDATDTYVKDGLSFNKKTGAITKYMAKYEVGKTYDIKIPSEIDGVKVTSIAERTFQDKREINSVEIAEGVTSLGEYAFSGCKNLRKVIVPDSVTSMGKETFEDCDNAKFYVQSERVKELLLNAGVKENQIVLNNTSTANDKNDTITDKYGLQFNKKTQTITGYNKGTGTSVTIAGELEGVKVLNIGERVFENRTELQEVDINDGVTSLGEYAFFGCKGLEEVRVPDSVTSMGGKTFEYCDNAKFYVQSERVKNLLLNACVKENQIVLNNTSTNTNNHNDIITDKYGLQFNKKTQTITAYNKGTGRDVTIAGELEGVKVLNIGERVFENRTELRSVDINDGVTSLGEYAFFGCKGLEEVRVPDSVTSMGGKTFEYCDNAKFYVQSERVKNLLLNACVKENQIVLRNQNGNKEVNKSDRNNTGSNNSNATNVNSSNDNSSSGKLTNSSSSSTNLNNGKVANTNSTNTNSSNVNSNTVNVSSAALKWMRNSDGTWKLVDGNGVKKGWQTVNNRRYFMDISGIMLTGWQSVGGKWYLMSSNGDMLTGWQQAGGKWYYLNGDGHMASNATVNGYKVGYDGAWIQ